MSRLERRLRIAAIVDAAAPRFDAEQVKLETALRGRTARRVRTSLRRMEPVVVATPRWSRADAFLEDLALDLAVGDPAIGCRTVDFRTLKGQSVGQVRQFVLHVFEQLGRRGWSAPSPTSVVDRRGFRYALWTRLRAAHKASPHRVALLAHGAEHLPVEVIDDMARVWDAYREMHPEGRRCTLLLAGSVQARWLEIGGAPRIELVDYGQGEAADAISSRAGRLPPAQLREVARFTGGVPDLVDAVGAAARSQAFMPRDPDQLLGRLGRVGVEIRGAVDIANSDSAAADRLHMLASGEPMVEALEVDHSLLMTGLIRRARHPILPHVVIRAPAIAALVA